MIPKHKYHAKRTEIDSISFSSKMESRYYSQLKLRQLAGDIVFFLRQIPFDLPGKVKYYADFMLFLSDGTVEIIDVKGMDTPLSIAKRKIVEDLYPITIKVVTSC